LYSHRRSDKTKEITSEVSFPPQASIIVLSLPQAFYISFSSIPMRKIQKKKLR